MANFQTSRGEIYAAVDVNTNPALVLVHGAGGSHLVWPRGLRRMKGFRVIAPDLRGHGRTPGPAHEDVDAHAADLAALLDALRIDRAILVGHSMGAAIALAFALATPERTAGLALLGAGAKMGVHPDLLAAARDDVPEAVRLFNLWAWGPATPPEILTLNAAAMLALPPGVLYADYLACRAFDIRDRVSTIHTPTLIITGTHDQMMPARYGEMLAAQIDGAQVVSMESGHMLMLEQPSAVGQVVETWLGSSGNASA